MPWRKTWISAGSAAVSHVTGKPYSLLNQLLLGKPGEYITFKQAQAEGGFVRKGEKSKFVVFWKFLEETDKDTGEITKHPYLRYYNVFRIDQCEGIKPHWDKPLENPAKPDEAAEAIVDAYVARSGVKITRTHTDQAFYRPSTDEIVVPEISQFKEAAEFYRDGRVYINKEQFFENVPNEQWIQYIGGYQPLQKWLKDRKGRVLTPEDIEHYKQMIQALIETQRIKAIDPETLEYCKSVIPTIEDVPVRLYAALLFFNGGGMRPEEVMGLRWEDIDLESGTAHVQRAVTYVGHNRSTDIKDTKTESSRRYVILPKVLVDVLRLEQRERGYVLHGRDPDEPMCYSTWQRTYRKMQDVLGIRGRYSNYDLRITFATQMIEAGQSAFSVAQMMGHKDSRMVETVYTRRRKEGLESRRALIEAMNCGGQNSGAICTSLAPAASL